MALAYFPTLIEREASRCSGGNLALHARPARDRTAVERQTKMINVLIWLLFGALVGWVASRLMRSIQANDAFLNAVAGGMGALIGGVVFFIFDTAPLDIISLWGLVCAIVGAIVTIGMAHIVVRRPI
jgi:uncharacterized membrane protein YeaQ/YmgE (transglycosylase-associated protein family)